MNLVLLHISVNSVITVWVVNIETVHFPLGTTSHNHSLHFWLVVCQFCICGVVVLLFYYSAKMCPCINHFHWNNPLFYCSFLSRVKNESEILAKSSPCFHFRLLWQVFSHLRRWISVLSSRHFSFTFTLVSYRQMSLVLPNIDLHLNGLHSMWDSKNLTEKKWCCCDQRSEWKSFLNYHQDTWQSTFWWLIVWTC